VSPSVSDPEDLSEADIRRLIEEIVNDPYLGDIEADARNSMRMIVAATFLGPEPDKLARFLGLPRDNFVRPRAKRLREAGIFISGRGHALGHVGIDEAVFEGENGSLNCRFLIWLSVAGLVADGLALRHEDKAVNFGGTPNVGPP
jgi:hypothetical protein